MTMRNSELDLLHRQVEDLKAEVIRLQQGESYRMQAQELLAESERRLSTLMANLPGIPGTSEKVVSASRWIRLMEPMP
jgi:hypothetical protein